MNYLTKDFFEAWREGGLRAYCYIDATLRFALARSDFVAAAELCFLYELMHERMALEVVAEMRALVKLLAKIRVRQVLVA